MNRTLVLVVLVLILVFLVYYAFNTPVQNVPQIPQTSGEQDLSTSTRATTSGDASTTPKELDVSIVNYSFSPAISTVAPGTRVVWINNDSVEHTVDGGNAFKSSTLAPGDTFSHVFPSAGDFTYICDLHPTMKGEIIVGQ